MNVDMRHPYAGKLVFTAFSGSHQDAINKGVRAMQERGAKKWEVPYLPIDPADVGRKYEPVVRINSQSGKGGVAFVMENVYGYKLPKEMQREFADIIQRISEREGGEVEPAVIMATFRDEYLERKSPFEYIRAKAYEHSALHDDVVVELEFKYAGREYHSKAEGSGHVDAALIAVKQCVATLDVAVLNFTEHALSEGTHAKAAAYIQMRDNRTGNVAVGVGVSSNITRASIKAFFSALNRLSIK